ncbi:MAG: DUF1577 domain-containing protein [Leptospiraceae bacterium]|nr:DUF1577 domain-containing protein [Leptospiraceae bacterium]
MQHIEREWQFVREPDKVSLLLREKVRNAKFYLKGTEPAAEVYRGADLTGTNFEFQYSPDIHIEDQITLYATLNRQLEIDFQVLQKPDEGRLVARPLVARISKYSREVRRILITNNEVSAGHFQASKSELALDNTRPQVANKVIYTEFERQLAKSIPGLQIFDFANRERPEETHLLDRSTESIFVADLSQLEQYKSHGEGFADFEELLEEEEILSRKRKEYLDRQYGSLVIVPILYEMANGSRKPVAFFFVLTDKGQHLDMQAVQQLQTASSQIVDRILDANMITVDDRQRIIDISPKGLLVELTQPELIKYVPNSRVLTFDLIFKMQAPLRFRGIVRHTRKTENALLVGMSIEGTGHLDGGRKSNALARLENLVQMLKTS